MTLVTDLTDAKTNAEVKTQPERFDDDLQQKEQKMENLLDTDATIKWVFTKITRS